MTDPDRALGGYQPAAGLPAQRASTVQIVAYGLRNGLVTLRQDGWRRVLDGTTTVEEVTRITKPDYLL